MSLKLQRCRLVVFSICPSSVFGESSLSGFVVQRSRFGKFLCSLVQLSGLLLTLRCLFSSMGGCKPSWIEFGCCRPFRTSFRLRPLGTFVVHPARCFELT